MQALITYQPAHSCHLSSLFLVFVRSADAVRFIQVWISFTKWMLIELWQKKHFFYCNPYVKVVHVLKSHCISKWHFQKITIQWQKSSDQWPYFIWNTTSSCGMFNQRWWVSFFSLYLTYDACENVSPRNSLRCCKTLLRQTEIFCKTEIQSAGPNWNLYIVWGKILILKS